MPSRGDLSVPTVRFGDLLLLGAAGSEWPRVAKHAREVGLELNDRRDGVAAENLHLVVQIGNRFQHEHPEIPVVLDKGRYLVVELDEARARALAARESRCYRVRPLPWEHVVYRVRQRAPGRRAPTVWIEELTENVLRSHVEGWLSHLASLPTRFSTSSGYATAAAWAQEHLRGMGYTTRIETIAVGAQKSANVIAEKPGDGTGRRDIVLVVAHLDSINQDGGPDANAPGADDNGSGSVGLLQIAFALRNHRGSHDLRFVLFGGEEQDLYGSRQYVGSLSAPERGRITAVVNMDMIATINTPAPTVLLEGAARSQSVIDGLAEAAATYASLVVQTSLDPFNSDHVPFLEAGIPAVLTIEGADRANRNVHTANDTLAHIDYDLMLDVLRMNVAFVASKVARGEPPSRLDVPSFIEAVRKTPFQYSGVYRHNGGASARHGRGFVDAPSGHSAAALADPIYNLPTPVFIEAPEDPTSARTDDEVRFTLHVDVDGPDPLNVVSGTVALGAAVPAAEWPHFVGRVTSNSAAEEGRHLNVGDFTFRWPQSSHDITQLTLELSGSVLTTPRAKVRFHDVAVDKTFGPYVVEQASPHFREVEVDVDRETNAVDVEPVSTHVHPDRPTDVPEEMLTLEGAFARAGIRISRSESSGTTVKTDEAGVDKRWTYSELHDSMESHWQAYADRAQWKMWIFLAELAESDSLGGVMFDAEINEPGGVDRQGTAIFTRCPHFHTAAGAYIQANPPADAAVQRELFFNLIHETGHAFNLAHSFEKDDGRGWAPPAWMPLKANPQALSWMNYPDEATPHGGVRFNASYFYKRFRFRFDNGELLFLRHAPETYLMMGGAAWSQNHGRVPRITLDDRLQLVLRSRKQVLELGEPVMVELRLRNVSHQPVTVHGALDPSDGLVEIAVTNPRGERRPFLPIDHTRTLIAPVVLAPGGGTIYEPVDMTMGSFGFPFKEPGAYRIEASYTNVDGTAAAAVMQLYIRPPTSFDAVPTLNELWNARVGRVLYVEGTRTMDDVNEKLDWIRTRLERQLGNENPIAIHLTTARFTPFATDGKIIEPRSNAVRTIVRDSDRVVQAFAPALTVHSEVAADTMGHIWYREAVDTYTNAAEATNQLTKARDAQELLLGLFTKREVVPSVCQDIQRRVDDLKAQTTDSRGVAAPVGRDRDETRGYSESDSAGS